MKVAFVTVVAGCAGAAPPPDEIIVFYMLTCHACFEGAETERLLESLAGLRSGLENTKVEAVDMMTPGSRERLNRMCTERNVPPERFAAPILFTDDSYITGHAKIFEYLSRLRR